MIEIERKTKGINTEMEVNGDKSISHRVAIFGAMSNGVTEIENFSDARDCHSTLECLMVLGVAIDFGERIEIKGKGLQNFKEPSDILNAGNSGTTIRLLSGLLAGQPFFSVITGDESLRRRPMDRVIVPLSLMGGEFWARGKNRYPPIAIKGRFPLRPIDYKLPVASAQVKSSIIIASLLAEGKSVVTEPLPSRDHTERILPFFGARVEKEGNSITIYGNPYLEGQKVYVPGDFSSASFFIVGGLIVPNSRIVIKNVGLNPGRIGLLNVIGRMGGRVRVEINGESLGEPFGDIYVESSNLSGTSISKEEVPLLIDELPLVAVLGAYANGETSVIGAEELRIKESDRIKAIVTEFRKLGVDIKELPDGFIVYGPNILEGATVESYNDHRIAMALAIAGLGARSNVKIRDYECVEISFPGFWSLLSQL
ncbi:MAG: 3-phosphoshikimate 1-carboxyvinyltransferase [bacterium]